MVNVDTYPATAVTCTLHFHGVQWWCDLGKDQEEQDDQCPPRTWWKGGQSPLFADCLLIFSGWWFIRFTESYCFIHQSPKLCPSHWCLLMNEPPIDKKQLKAVWFRHGSREFWSGACQHRLVVCWVVSVGDYSDIGWNDLPNVGLDTPPIVDDFQASSLDWIGDFAATFGYQRANARNWISAMPTPSQSWGWLCRKRRSLKRSPFVKNAKRRETRRERERERAAAICWVSHHQKRRKNFTQHTTPIVDSCVSVDATLVSWPLCSHQPSWLQDD